MNTPPHVHPTKRSNAGRDKKASRSRGMALIMIVFMIALASAILISLTDSTYVAMRLNSAAEQRIKSEYILKSAVNVAQVLIKNDITNFDDPTQDAWMMFADGREIPGELLALPEPNIRVSLLIVSTNGKIPLLRLYSSGAGVNQDWKAILLRLFEQLGFDQPLPMNESPDKTPLPDSKQLLSNLIDYLDTDEDNFAGDGLLPAGIEESLPDGRKFRNSGTIDSLANELPAVPGFSPGRIQRLLPYVTKTRTSDINVNAAPPEVIAAVVTDPSAAEAIEQCRSKGPIQTPSQDLFACGSADPNNSKFRGQGQWYEVIAKVEYGTAMFMASAELDNSVGSGRLPKLKSFQMY